MSGVKIGVGGLWEWVGVGVFGRAAGGVRGGGAAGRRGGGEGGCGGGGAGGWGGGGVGFSWRIRRKAMSAPSIRVAIMGAGLRMVGGR